MSGNRVSGLDDETLMARIQSGDERALTEIYQRYSTKMVRYFYRMLWQDTNKAQDFLHDLFVRIIEKPESFDTRQRFSTWIYSVAHNMCKNEYRKVNFRKSVQPFITAPVIVQESATEQIDNSYLQKAIEKAMAGWEDDDRSLFVFRHELEMTFGEIATVLGCPEGTAKSRWFYLRKELAENFRDFKVMLKAI
jgi:RNA polymerase sigma-70 factor, ECF subfamily